MAAKLELYITDTLPSSKDSVIASLKANPGDDNPAQVEVRDLLGRTIYTNFITSSKDEFISLHGYSNGVYVGTVNRGKELLHTTKLVKQD